MSNWSRVLKYFRPDVPRIVGALGLMLLSVAANVAKPWPVAIILDSLIGSKPLPDWIPRNLAEWGIPALIALFALFAFVLHVLAGALAAGQNYLSIQAGLNGLARIRNQLFAWMQRLSLAFYQRANQGDLIYRASWDTYSLQTLFQQGFFKFLGALCSVALMLVVMGQLNLKLMLITLALFPPVGLTMYFFGRAMNKRSLAAHQADSQVTSLVQQNITSLPLIQSYTRERQEQARYENQVQGALEKRTRQHGLEVVYWLVIAILFGLATALITWWGAREILADRLTVGELVVFLSYLGQLYDPLNQLSHVGATVSDANAGLHRIFEILDTKEEMPQAAHPKKVNPRGGIVLDQVSFGYTPENPVLRDLSFEIKPGEVVGIAGPSGSGKTTLLNLLPRFFDPQHGTVRIGDTDLREADLEHLREQIAYVFQESFLFPATIAENIAAGREGCTREEIVEAARRANAAEFIEKLPQGFDTLVGEGAARLSVGEKQRINIARAFLKDAPILLLDEPTSALDAETELLILDSLSRLFENRTVLMVAHRLSTLRQVKRIVVLEEGRITQIGTPEKMFADGGYYARAAERQKV